MPVSLITGEAWEESRKLLARSYRNIIILSIAGAASTELSFSADTDLGECLVVGRKVEDASITIPQKDRRVVFVVLAQRPAFPLLGAYAARQINELMETGGIKKLEDGPSGGTPIAFGADIVGHAIDAALPADGTWHIARIADLTLAQTAYQLMGRAKVWLPTMSRTKAKALPMTTLGKIAKIGPYHSDVVGKTAKKGVRGPFARQRIQPGTVPTYPCLWAHKAARERTLAFEPDSDCLPLKGTSP